jgi:putative membrane-bound dehydrogenase-like protein
MIRLSHVAFLLLSVFLIACASRTNTGQKNTAQVDGHLAEGHLAEGHLADGRRAEVLFLGHKSKHHDSYKFAPWLSIKLFRSGINTTYIHSLDDLTEERLSRYDGLIIYANYEVLPKDKEDVLKKFVASGKALIPLHSASGCFRNSDWYIQTIGGAFESHKTGRFTNKIVNGSHPVMAGIGEFETWDETYVHKRLNPDITVLGERVEGNHREPYTWVRTEGKSRIFYTAYGHEDTTWTNIEFLNLVRNGVVWALGDQVMQQVKALNIPDVDIYNADTMAAYTKRHVVPKIQDALSPKESMKLTQLPVDFEIQLFAQEPDITNPIAMAWDERGRLWIVESVDYPNTFKETDGASNDRIKICEDTDGDGKADKFTVFADNLNIPTSIAFANGGVIVSMAPNFLFLKDTNGDDVADVRETIMSGWNKFDTHAGPSNLQYGFDNKIWGVTGYSGFQGTINGKKTHFPQGLYHFSPDGKQFDYLANTSNNTWGLGFSEDNNVFISTANNTHSAFYSMPAKNAQRLPVDDQPTVQPIQKIDGHYDAHPLTPNFRQVDVVGGFTSAAGHHLYTARDFPKEYWNRIAFVCEPTIRLIHNAVLEKDGAGFKEEDGWNMAASSDEWFGPVQATVGPDGALWVADWYNFIIQHNVFVPRQSPSEFILPFIEQPHGQGNAFISPLRDIHHGRVYRIVHKNSRATPAPKLARNDANSLIAALKHSNMFWRMTAQRLLVESKNTGAANALFEIIRNRSVDEVGLNSPAVHAVWTLHGLGLLNGNDPAALAVVTEALTHPAAGVRKAAVMALPATKTSFESIQKVGLLTDPDLNTRLAVFNTLATYEADDQIGKALATASRNAENEKDKWLSKSLSVAAFAHEKGFRAGDTSGTLYQKILAQMEHEVYAVGRRTNLPFSPDVMQKEITITTTLSPNDKGELNGFVIGHGNATSGYALYVDNGKVHWVVHQHGHAAKIQSEGKLPNPAQVTATLRGDGQTQLLINGQSVGTARTHMLFAQTLEPGLRSGEDYDDTDRLGAYSGKFPFVGNVQNTKIALNKPSARTNEPVAKTSMATEGTTLNLSVVLDAMQYDKKLLTVKAGEKVTIVFDNPDGMPHNLLILKPGTLAKVGKAADDLLRDPKAAEKHYVPATSDVLHATRLLNTGESESLVFTVPSKPGDYPYVCTFPGHWRGMNGILRVVK